MRKVNTVDEYIESCPTEHQEKIKQLRQIIKSAAPKAEEKISYAMPYYGYKGRLVYFGIAKNHLGLYLIPPTIAEHQSELKKYKTSPSTIQFPWDEELPAALIKKLIKVGIKRNEDKSK